VSRDGLVEALWAGCAPRSAVNTMQDYVLRVRRSLQVTGLRIVTGPGGYRLDAAPGSVDAGLAERLVTRGRAALAAGDRVAGGEALRSALGLWRGPSFGEFADRVGESAPRRAARVRPGGLCPAGRPWPAWWLADPSGGHVRRHDARRRRRCRCRQTPAGSAALPELRALAHLGRSLPCACPHGRRSGKVERTGASRGDRLVMAGVGHRLVVVLATRRG